MTEDEQALAELIALVQVPGALQIITSEIVPALRTDAANPRSLIREDVIAGEIKRRPKGMGDLDWAERAAARVSPNVLLRRVDTFVRHAVTRIEVIPHRGCVRAYSDKGDWTEGRAAAVLKRLREWRG